MNTIWITYAFSYFIGFIASVSGKRIVLEQPGIKRANTRFAIAAALLVIFISGFRYNVGDTAAYRFQYMLIGNDIQLALTQKDFLFYLIGAMLNFITTNSQAILMFSSIITIACIFYALYKYADSFELGVFLFFATGIFLSAMNGMRQWIAASIIFAAIKLVIDKKWLLYFLLVLFVSFIHGSAIIMIPAYFVINRKAWDYKTVLLIVASLAAYLTINIWIFNFLDMVQDTRYEIDSYYFTQSGMDSNIIRVFVEAVPVVLAFVYRKRLHEFWDKSDIFVNLSIINFIIMLFASYNWIFSRFNFYFQISNLILIPWIIKYGVKTRLRPMMYYATIVLYLFYFYYQTVVTFNLSFRLIF